MIPFGLIFDTHDNESHMDMHETNKQKHGKLTNLRWEKQRREREDQATSHGCLILQPGKKGSSLSQTGTSRNSPLRRRLMQLHHRNHPNGNHGLLLTGKEIGGR